MLIEETRIRECENPKGCDMHRGRTNKADQNKKKRGKEFCWLKARQDPCK